MYTTTEAIILHLAKYNDNTSILHAYTKDNGRMQYIVHIGKKRSLISQLQPFSYVEIESSVTNGNSQFRHLKSVRLLYVPKKTDFCRLTVNIFLSEVLYRILRHPMADTELFQYLSSVVQEIDQKENIENSHLKFLLNLTSFLGIMPSMDMDAEWLDMQTGLSVSAIPSHNDCFSKQEMLILNALNDSVDVSLSRSARQILLEKLCRYYELHVTDFYMPKSLEILKELFD